MSLALVFPVGTALAWLLAQAAPLVPATPPAPLAPFAPATPEAPPAAPMGPPAPFAPSVHPHIRAVRTTERPVIDGKLDDPAWAGAIPSDTFTQHFPSEGTPPSERTVVRILYDDDALYVGVDCEQVHAPVVKRLMRRDTQLASDGVWVDIDSRRDGVSAFHFGVNAAGVLSDAVHFNDLDYSADWDAVWEGRAADTPRGYSVELRIPLYVLRFEALPVQDWGFELRRFIEAVQETDDWAFFPRSAGSYIPLFGRIDDLANLSPRHALQLRPFGLVRERHRAAGAVAGQNTLAHGWDTALSAGLDAKAAVTNELTLDLTVLPDFGQVEADAVVLNLSTFETFFPEKRPFFLEGTDTFSTLRQLLYTRRIGHQPATPTMAPNETPVDLPDPSPIYGAAKLVGTIGGRTTVGLLSAVTGENSIDVQTKDPTSGVTTVGRRTAEPLSTYNVLRLKRLVSNDSSVGLLATATNRFEPLYPPGQPCPETNASQAGEQRCTNDAYAAAVDGRWRSPGGDYVLAAQALGTSLVHGPARTPSDGIAIHPGTISGGGSVDLDKVGGKHWLWSVDQQISGRQLELNDLGYLDRKNDYLGTFALQYRTIEPWWKTLETHTAVQADMRRSLDGVDLPHGFVLDSYWVLTNYWTLYLRGDLRGAWHDDREFGDGRALERGARQGVEWGVGGDPRRRVLWNLNGQALHVTNGAHYEVHGDLTVRVRPQLELELAPGATYDQGEPRWISAVSLLGRQEARSIGATVRAAYTFTPELSLQVYSQVFLARVHYTQFFANPSSVGPRGRVDLASLTPEAVQPDLRKTDTETATLNVNVVVRWEYHLGSTVFLVYTRAQTPSLALSPNGATSLDLHPVLTGQAATDVVMLKIAYWFG